mgnify:CR=1 FL=1
MSIERKIKPVKNNQDKSNTYSFYKSQLNKAIKYEFYLEAIMIEYAMMEDRLRSFIYHIGGLASRNSIKIGSKKTKQEIKYIVSRYRQENEKDNLGITNISGKEKIIRCILRWSLDEEKEINDNNYLKTLNNQLHERIDINQFLKLLDEVDEWCSYRNELVHALMNKSTDSIQEKIADQANLGQELAEKLSAEERKIKYYQKVRKAANLQTE